MHVACATDEAFVPHCATMLHSLLSTGDQGIEVHVLAAEDVCRAQLDRLGAMVDEMGGRLHAVPAPAGELLPDLNEVVGSVVWYRLFLADLLPGLDRVIFLDCDLIVCDSIRALWHSRLRGAPVAAVTDVAPSPEWARRHCEFLGIADPGLYFNAGVVLLDLDRWRRRDLGATVREFALARADRAPSREFREGDERAFLEYMFSHPDQLLFAEQDALNGVLASQRQILHPRWNCTTRLHWLAADSPGLDRGQVAEAIANPAIRHFEGPGVSKPWHPDSRAQGRELYWHHRSQIPWP